MIYSVVQTDIISNVNKSMKCLVVALFRDHRNRKRLQRSVTLNSVYFLLHDHLRFCFVDLKMISCFLFSAALS